MEHAISNHSTAMNTMISFFVIITLANCYAEIQPDRGLEFATFMIMRSAASAESASRRHGPEWREAEKIPIEVENFTCELFAYWLVYGTDKSERGETNAKVLKKAAHHVGLAKISQRVLLDMRNAGNPADPNIPNLTYKLSMLPMRRDDFIDLTKFTKSLDSYLRWLVTD